MDKWITHLSVCNYTTKAVDNLVDNLVDNFCVFVDKFQKSPKKELSTKLSTRFWWITFNNLVLSNSIDALIASFWPFF